MSAIHWDSALQAAEAAARAAGSEIRAMIGRPRVTTTKSSPHDLVTEVDKRCQEIIATHLLRDFPQSSFLGEEQVAAGADAAAQAIHAADTTCLWVVDPIDGTLNFIRGIPACTVSIGLVIEDIATVGVIYDPLRDEMFTGAVGVGAWLNGNEMRVSGEAQLSHAVLGSGFGAIADRRPQAGYPVRSVRAFGSAAMHLAYVAAGRLDGYWEYDLNAWDVCAGAVLVTSASGRVGDVDGSPFTLCTRNIVATNGWLHEVLLQDLAAAHEDAPDWEAKDR